jgi:predicted O-methyltransferase YrrM
VSFVGRASGRYRAARLQAPALRVGYVLAPVHRRSTMLLRRRLRALTRARGAAAFAREIESDGLAARLSAAEDEYRALTPGTELAPGSVYPAEGALLYTLVRSLRPETVVETGTANGFSTSYLLAALHRNGAGRLISIDLPFTVDDAGGLQSVVDGTSIDIYDSSPIPEGKQSGWAIPAELRARWELKLGDARELLPSALAEVGEIQIFFHDSLHTREHMLFEFETAWPHLAMGGVLVADDVFQRRHDALPSFARSVGRPFSTFGNLGLVVKR